MREGARNLMIEYFSILIRQEQIFSTGSETRKRKKEKLAELLCLVEIAICLKFTILNMLCLWLNDCRYY